MDDRENENIFPLPLSPFEKYLLADDRPTHPMAFAIEVDFAGRFHRPALAAALVEVLKRHPLLRARVQHSSKHGYVWVLGEESQPTIVWQVGAAPLIALEQEKINLDREPGLRLWVREDDAGATLTMQIHHACCDGMGAFQVLADLLVCYGREVLPGQPPSLSPLAPQSLLSRDKHLSEPAQGSRGLAFLWRCIRETIRIYLWQRPLPLSAPKPSRVPNPSKTSFPHILAYRFDAAETQMIRQAAQAQQVFLNDLLLRDLFLTLRKWNKTHRPGSEKGWLRILVPVNLRDRKTALPAVNRMSYLFLNRRGASCTDETAGRLLQTIHEETEARNTQRLARAFAAVLAFFQNIQLMNLFIHRKECFTTAILTNVGDPSRQLPASWPRQGGKIQIGDLLLDGYRGTAPLRPLTRVAFSVGTYAGQLTVCSQADPHLFTAEEAKELLDLFVTQLRSSQQFLAGGGDIPKEIQTGKHS